ncbi:MAG: DNA primase [Bacteroidales bacterium]|nr:DNA primase [Bacteroidales bacterium]
MISQNTKQDIIDRADIVEVVGDFVKLKKKGTNHTGLCPFHNEKTGSFTVSSAKQIYKCFGCGAGGDSIKFLIEHEKKTFPEALRYLADKYNILIEEEKPDPEAKKKANLNEKLYHLNELAAKFFNKNATDSQITYLKERFTKEEIEQWQIGFAPDQWDALLNHFKKLKVKDEYLQKTDLVKYSEKKKDYYDFFRNRVMFPITDNSGRIAGFGGRIIEGEDAKYLNSPDSDIYPKARTLYGLNFARKEISNDDNCNIVEGYTDVISMHTAEVINTVAPCGTALTVKQLQLIKRYTKTLTLIYDADEGGVKAAQKNGKLAIENGFNVYICFLPEGEDPDSFAKAHDGKLNDWISDNRKDYLLQRAKALLDSANGDLMVRHEAINDICGMLFHLDKIKQGIYIEQICKDSKQKTKVFTDKLSELKCEAAPSDEKTWLPDNVDPNDFEKWGFYSYKNEYHFRTKEGIQKFSNFIMKPVFHIDSIYDSRRIYEMINSNGHRVVINLDMNEMVGLQAFQRNIEAKGNFMFWGTMAHFQKLKLKLYQETRTCEEIKVLGWQKEGFWAWSNGIIADGKFQEIDEYGVVKYKDNNYFIPAFSKIYISDKSVFLDERKFKFKESKLEIREWMDLYLKVHGDNAMIGFAFYLAALFRDYILYLNNNFPILNLYGQRGSGKNTMAYSLLSLFGKHQNEFNINNGTQAGLAKYLEMFSNTIGFIDEYKNSIDFTKIETLKSIYNAIGRSRLNMDKGMRKETTEVNQAVILAGQEMPTVDIALSTRVIFLTFLKKENLSIEQKKNLEELEGIERDGLSHITNQVIHHREYFVKHYKKHYTQVINDLVDKTKGEEIDERLIRNMASVCAAFSTLEKKFDFSFKYTKLINYSSEVIREHSRQIKQSDEVGIFWNLLEAMYDDNILIDRWHFRIKHSTSLETNEGKKNWPEGKRLLFFKFNAVAKLYAEQLRKRGEKPLPQDSLKHYLKTNKYFVGIVKSIRFVIKSFDQTEGKYTEKSQTTTAICFDYDKLGINLERTNLTDLDKMYPEDDNIPF